MKKKKQNPFLPFILMAAVVVITIVGLIIAGQVRQARIDNPGVFTSQDDIPRLTVQEAFEAQANGEAVIVDTRSAAQFEASRIAGSINIPLDEIDSRMSELDPDIWYLTYCT